MSLNLKFWIYQEGSVDYPFKPQEDAYAYKDNIFVVADGVTHDIDGLNWNYPQPSDSAKVAEIVSKTISEEYKGDLNGVFNLVNSKVHEFNIASDLYKNRENNGFTIGAAVFSIGIIEDNYLHYHILHDCNVQVFDENMNKKINIYPYVNISADYYESHNDSKTIEGRKVWRKDMRNSWVIEKGVKIGYGAVDGVKDFSPFIQSGRVELTLGDLILIYSDGFESAVHDNLFIEILKKDDFSYKTFSQIAEYLRVKKYNSEKTMIIIKY